MLCHSTGILSSVFWLCSLCIVAWPAGLPIFLKIENKEYHAIFYDEGAPGFYALDWDQLCCCVCNGEHSGEIFDEALACSGVLTGEWNNHYKNTLCTEWESCYKNSSTPFRMPYLPFLAWAFGWLPFFFPCVCCYFSPAQLKGCLHALFFLCHQGLSQYQEQMTQKSCLSVVAISQRPLATSLPKLQLSSNKTPGLVLMASI